MTFEVQIDQDVCTGSASCVQWEPSVFALDDDSGLAVVVDAGAASEENIITVAHACPTGAIVVSRDSEVIVG